jgi:hypothetical protein
MISNIAGQVAKPRTSGFVERFNKTVLDAFCYVTFRERLYTSVDELPQNLDQWFYRYDYARPHRGYRNMGGHPIESRKICQRADVENKSLKIVTGEKKTVRKVLVLST